MAHIRPGAAIELEGESYVVLSAQHVHKGRGGASIACRLKNIVTGQVRETTVRESDHVEELRVERHEGTYSYTVEDELVFFDNESFEEIRKRREDLGDTTKYLVEGCSVTLMFVGGELVGIDPPIFIELRVAETEPGVRGDTASGGSKPARLSTGLSVSVPLFVETDDVVRIDTRSDKYIERVR